MSVSYRRRITDLKGERKRKKKKRVGVGIEGMRGGYKKDTFTCYETANQQASFL